MFKAPFSFDGRIRRIEYFLSGIVGGIVFSIAWALGIGTFILGAGMGSAGGSVFGLLIGLAALVASMWFSLAQGVKRLHDLDKSGWLILLSTISTRFTRLMGRRYFHSSESSWSIRRRGNVHLNQMMMNERRMALPMNHTTEGM